MLFTFTKQSCPNKDHFPNLLQYINKFPFSGRYQEEKLNIKPANYLSGADVHS